MVLPAKTTPRQDLPILRDVCTKDKAADRLPHDLLLAFDLRRDLRC